MAWNEQIFRYCERALDGAFWAEPLNAVTNIGFVLAGVVAAIELGGTKRKAVPIFEWMLVALVLAIGAGSFLFHTFATRWAAVADTAPIGLFMIAYLGFALSRLSGLGLTRTLLGLAAFLLSMKFAESLPCAPGLLPITRAGGHPCLNGSLGYIPAFGALLLVGAWLVAQRHAAAYYVLAAAALFAMSLTLRSIDFEVCQVTRLMGRPRGTHALWHLLNALTLYMLLAGAIRHGGRRDARRGAGVVGSA